MTSKMVKIFVVVLALAAFAGAATIPSGTHVTIRLDSAISSATAHTGDSFTASLAKDVVVNGQTVAKAGSPVQGKVAYARSSGRLSKPGVVTIRVTSIAGQTVRTGTVSRQGQSHTKSNATKIGGGAAAGAVIGALAGGGKGAAIGAGVGAGAGTGVAAATGKKEAVIPSESALGFTVQ
jgi:hypothetical protein